MKKQEDKNQELTITEQEIAGVAITTEDGYKILPQYNNAIIEKIFVSLNDSLQQAFIGAMFRAQHPFLYNTDKKLLMDLCKSDIGKKFMSDYFEIKEGKVVSSEIALTQAALGAMGAANPKALDIDAMGEMKYDEDC